MAIIIVLFFAAICAVPLMLAAGLLKFAAGTAVEISKTSPAARLPKAHKSAPENIPVVDMDDVLDNKLGPEGPDGGDGIFFESPPENWRDLA